MSPAALWVLMLTEPQALRQRLRAWDIALRIAATSLRKLQLRNFNLTPTSTILQRLLDGLRHFNLQPIVQRLTATSRYFSEVIIASLLELSPELRAIRLRLDDHNSSFGLTRTRTCILWKPPGVAICTERLWHILLADQGLKVCTQDSRPLFPLPIFA